MRPLTALFPFTAALVATALAGEPEIASVQPRAVFPGLSTRVELRGKDLGGPVELWTGFPSESTAVEVSPDGRRAVFDVRAAAGAQVGVHGLRLVTREGISNLALVMVDDLPSVSETAASGGDGTGRGFELPVAVDGACDEDRPDRFTFEARAGRTVTIEVVAQRLGSTLDPVLRLLDRDGRELAVSNDAPGLGEDSRVRHTFSRDGLHAVEVRDVFHRGGEGFHYRLRAGDFPDVAGVFPMGGPAGAATRVAFAVAPEGVEDAVVPLPDLVPGARVPVGFRTAGSDASAFVTVEVSGREEVLEAEPNDAADSATEVEALPVTLNGRFDRPGDVDLYRFRVRKGERLLVEGRTRSLGSPSHLFLRLLGDDGAALAEADPSGADEGRLAHRFGEDGIYLLLVEELNRSGGPGHGYRIDIGPALPRVALTVAADRVFVRDGSAFELTVSCEREKYDGPIELEVEGLGEVALENAVIAEKQKETKLRVRIVEPPADGRLRLARIVGVVRESARGGDGRGEGGGSSSIEHRITASTRPALEKPFPRLFFPPGALDESIAVALRAPPRRARF